MSIDSADSTIVLAMLTGPISVHRLQLAWTGAVVVFDRFCDLKSDLVIRWIGGGLEVGRKEVWR